MTAPIRRKHWGSDRFIPFRRPEKATNYAAQVAADALDTSLTSTPHRRAVSKACLGVSSPTDLKILSAVTTLSPEPRLWSQSPHKDLPAILSRTATQMLDAPNLFPDFYSNPFSYSTEHRLLAIGLGSSVWIWNADTNRNSHLAIAKTAGAITSIAWNPLRKEIFVGKGTGELLCATVSNTLVWTKTITSPSDTSTSLFGSLALWGNDLFAGNQSGRCYKINRRTGIIKNSWLIPTTGVGGIPAICQIKISPDGQYLAIGSGNKSITIYEIGTTGRENPSSIFHKVMDAAVKGIAFDPTGKSRIAFGTGMDDRRILIVSFLSGEIIRTIHTGAQVTSLHWDTPRTLLATLGVGKMAVATFPSMLSVPVDVMHGDPVHMRINSIANGVRILHSANLSNTSPPQWVILSNDETIRFFSKEEEAPPPPKRLVDPMMPSMR